MRINITTTNILLLRPSLYLCKITVHHWNSK